MRCNNCGFENANDARHCVKCNTLLDSAETKQAETAAPTSRKETSYAATISDSSLPENHAGAPLISCPHPDCGYPYSSELKACPRCKRPATTTDHTTANQTTANHTTAPNHTTANHAAATKPPTTQKPDPIKGTIDPYRIKAAPEPPPPSCWLLPITKTGEKPAETPAPVTLTYADRSIDLNRDTLEPGNTSITGKVQAQLTFKDGAWQLIDQSELQTTFLQVSTATTLKEGDIILFGDRKFIFSRSNPQI